jgi:hypothetical protein
VGAITASTSVIKQANERSAKPTHHLVYAPERAALTQLAIGTFSNSQGSNARMTPFGYSTAIVAPIPITRIGTAHEWWRTKSPSRNS